MNHPAAPAAVRAFVANPPEWIEIIPVDFAACFANALSMPDLDPGEVSAITLAAADPQSLLLMDEAAGRAQAARLGIQTTGTPGVLRDAALAGFIDLSNAIKKLRGTSFRIPEAVVAALLRGQ